jgi:hypothetical protein
MTKLMALEHPRDENACGKLSWRMASYEDGELFRSSYRHFHSHLEFSMLSSLNTSPTSKTSTETSFLISYFHSIPLSL